MFTKPLEYIFLPSALKEAYEKINQNSSGLDEVNFREFENKFEKNIANLSKKLLKAQYSPEPLKKIEIDKPDSDKKRPIALSAIKDKIVQRVLYENLNPYFDKLFSNKSYAYRPEKSTLKAINRVTQFLNEKKFHILKTDIENFFENIDHDILLKILDIHIKDRSITRLISLFIQVGGFNKMDFDEHLSGVHQGDILSPLLSNIYLNEMDIFLEKQDISFVRYADDFVLLFNSKNEAYSTQKKLRKFLKTIKLTLNKEKTSILHVSDGFVFLGVEFKGKNRLVQNERLQKSISKIYRLAKNRTGFKKYIDELNSYLLALKNYYLKIITKNATQHSLLQKAVIESISNKVYLSKKNRIIKTKKEFKMLLSQVKFHILFEDNIDDIIELIIAKGYERYLSDKSYKDNSSILDKKKNSYAKKFADDATLHVATEGLSLGISKNSFVLKKYAKVQKKYPIDRVKRIILEGQGFSLSSNVIKKCADNAITMDFIDRKGVSYASLITYKSTLAQNINTQSKILNTPKQLELAKAFIKGKAKNQLNYIKYLNKYHKFLDKEILSIEKIYPKIKFVSSIDELMGVEGSISASYWSAIRLVLEVPFEKRITFGAKDIVNSSLNYAYAILYGKVQHSLVYAGLSLNISFLHTLDEKKPTLTFDMIEEFRTFIVDRTIISMLNRDEPVKLSSDGLLTKPSRKLIAKNIKEKLGSYTMWKKESRKIENIIQTQSFLLAKVIDNRDKKYRPFIGKY